MIKKTSTKGMDREQWLASRKKSIGGSDAAALLGLNPYQSPYALWAEKLGKLQEADDTDNEAIRIGNDLEEYVAQRFAEATGKKVRKSNYIITNTDYPFAHANIDREVVGEDAGLECKTTSSWETLQKCRAGDFPDHWYAQMVHYMLTTGKQRWYLGVLCLGKGFFHFCIERNEDEIKALAEAERQFWQLVETETPPAVDGSEATEKALRALLPDSSPYSVDLSGVATSITIYNSTKNQIRQLEAQLTEHQNTIMQYMGDAEKGEWNGTKISFKTQTRKNFNRKAYEADHGPIEAMYFTESKSRPFKVTVN